ncbi:putative T6SS immunity periplasmic lipoprotein [Enterobacter bugandensis]|uniref:putative T6SS immunity periplasmic lipoprotein n=1 Tax=Enterobacter bugandensis TaxID=881260 RepID=UPI002003FF3E|nr:putative T6SS immunity periplasmic lipoprotein [Enterobacter bugandensis]MCK6953315.1 hypothetical protein [Enterobacter bugandensis]MCK7208855.1 hypothetical protein [Enterobacter bugandensis]MCM7316226.1 hypothetical protein [Enterobacter bugandensis]MCM7351780.1 hypothetical protein [Enterobacter bugandensis]
MRYISLLLSIICLAGCPVKGKEGAASGERRSIYVYDGRVCFSVDKKDILSRYVLASNGKNYSELLKGDLAVLSYPATCFNVSLNKGVVYGAHYTLNKKNFYYTFIVDNQGNILDLGRK